MQFTKFFSKWKKDLNNTKHYNSFPGKIMNYQDYRMFTLVFYLAVNKLITDKTENIFIFHNWTFYFHKMFLKQTRLNYWNKWYNFFKAMQRKIIQCWGKYRIYWPKNQKNNQLYSVCMWERERERERERHMLMCVCVCEREREAERERHMLYVCVRHYMYMCNMCVRHVICVCVHDKLSS